MTEEKNGLTHGPANSEMAPQEDGTKVPLTDEPGVSTFDILVPYRHIHVISIIML